MSKINLRCRECKKEYDPTFKYICDECFGPLDVHYDFPSLTKNTFVNREQTYWRYFELLPITDKSNIVSINAGMTPLVRAEKLGKKIGLNNLYIKMTPLTQHFHSRTGQQALLYQRQKNSVWLLWDVHLLEIWHQLQLHTLLRRAFRVTFLLQVTLNTQRSHRHSHMVHITLQLMEHMTMQTE